MEEQIQSLCNNGSNDSGSRSDSSVRVQIKHDWYQTESNVIVSMLTKNLQAEDEINVDVQPNSVDVTVMLADSTEVKTNTNSLQNVHLHLDLMASVKPELSTWKRFASKVEIKLVKAAGGMWNRLEKPLSTAPTAANSSVSNFNMSRKEGESDKPAKIHRDWDKIAADISRLDVEEKAEGEAGVNKLFQDLYEGGSDEVRRAMNKSFMESGGTVLSTNWKEVGKETVKMKPPEGIEFKRWDQ